MSVLPLHLHTYSKNWHFSFFSPLVKTNIFPFFPPSAYTYLPKTDICQFFFSSSMNLSLSPLPDRGWHPGGEGIDSNVGGKGKLGRVEGLREERLEGVRRWGKGFSEGWGKGEMGHLLDWERESNKRGVWFFMARQPSMSWEVQNYLQHCIACSHPFNKTKTYKLKI